MLWLNFTCIRFWNLCECVNASSVSKRVQTACFESAVNSVAHPDFPCKVSLEEFVDSLGPGRLWQSASLCEDRRRPHPSLLNQTPSARDITRVLTLRHGQKRERHCRRADGNECCGVSEAHMRKRGGGGRSRPGTGFTGAPQSLIVWGGLFLTLQIWQQGTQDF